VIRQSIAAILLLIPLNTIADSSSQSPLPSPTRAEVVAFTFPGATDGPTAKLDEKQARELAKLTHALKWLGSAGACDKKQYEMRLYNNDTLISDDAICFNCGCFTHLNSDAAAVSFDIEEVHARHLKKFLENLFPLNKQTAQGTPSN
jgi:hypothetical protein